MDAGILLLNIPFLIVSVLMLWKGADWVVDSASKIAHQFGVSDLVIGLTVVAIGTSAPEFAVTITAALTERSSISIGNVIGSNVFNLGFILGGTACFRAIQTNPRIVYRDGIFLTAVTVLLYFFLYGFSYLPTEGDLSRIEGAILVLILLLYLFFLFLNKEPLEEEIPKGNAVKKDWFFLILGIASIVGGGHFLVESASAIAREFGVSDWVIGVTIVAAGTSAPELATSLTAMIKNRHGIAIGNLLGSDLFNLLGVLGLASLLHPMVVEVAAHQGVLLLIGMVILVLVFMRTHWRISRMEGAILVCLNSIRWCYDFLGK